jgi:hypothetical protein
LNIVLAVITPTRRVAATSPLKGEVEFLLLPSGEKVPEGRMRGWFGIERQAVHRGDFSIFPFSVSPVWVFTVPSAPSSGPAGHLLPDGEKREVAMLSTANSHARKIRRGFAGSVYLAGALESADD